MRFILIILLTIASSAYSQDRQLFPSLYTTWDYSNIPENDFIDNRGKLAFGVGIQLNYKLTDYFEITFSSFSQKIRKDWSELTNNHTF